MTSLPPFGESIDLDPIDPFRDYDADAVVEDALVELEDRLFERILARLQENGVVDGIGRVHSGEEGWPQAGVEAGGAEDGQAEGEAE